MSVGDVGRERGGGQAGRRGNLDTGQSTRRANRVSAGVWLWGVAQASAEKTEGDHLDRSEDLWRRQRAKSGRHRQVGSELLLLTLFAYARAAVSTLRR